MNPEIFTHYGSRLRTRVKIAHKKVKIFLIQTKMYIISSIEIAYFYMQEFRVQAKVFKNNIITNQINKYDYEKIRNN